MTGRAYTEPRLVEIHQEMSELMDKQVNAQKEKSSGILPQAHEKCAMKITISRIRKKRCPHKNVIHGRKPFIMPKQKTSENNLLGNNCGYNEGTICVVNW